ncbi:MAG: SCP2 sterol-binding domain-containing protein [Gaiellaceae bacterium]
MSAQLDSFFAGLPARAAGRDLTGVRATYVFTVEGDKAWTVRIEGQEVTVRDGADPGADCTISASEETFMRLIDRTRGVMSAYMSGKLKISGDLGAAMQLNKLIS